MMKAKAGYFYCITGIPRTRANSTPEGFNHVRVLRKIIAHPIYGHGCMIDPRGFNRLQKVKFKNPLKLTEEEIFINNEPWLDRIRKILTGTDLCIYFRSGDGRCCIKLGGLTKKQKTPSPNK